MGFSLHMCVCVMYVCNVCISFTFAFTYGFTWNITQSSQTITVALKQHLKNIEHGPKSPPHELLLSLPQDLWELRPNKMIKFVFTAPCLSDCS